MSAMIQMAIRKVGLGGRDSGNVQSASSSAEDERRREFLKHIQDTTQAVQNASTRLQLAAAEFASSLDALSSAFDALDRVTQITVRDKTDAEIALEAEDSCTTLRSACVALQSQLSELRGMEQDNLDKFLQGEVHEPMLRLFHHQREVEALRHACHRSARVLEAAQGEVLSKEKEYQSKVRPISESKLYPQLVQNLEDAKSAFETTSETFHQACDVLMSDSRLVAAQCFQASLYRVGTWMESVSDRIGGIVSLCNR
jgi:hypothetical protein